MGRPRNPFTNKTYNIILSEELYDWVQKIARQKGKSGASYIREILAKEKRIEDRLKDVMDALDTIAPPTITVLGDDT
jgi:predicted DNA-binding protein